MRRRALDRELQPPAVKRPDVRQRQVDVRREGGSYLEAGFLYVVPGEGLGSTAAAGALAAAPADRSRRDVYGYDGADADEV